MNSFIKILKVTGVQNFIFSIKRPILAGKSENFQKVGGASAAPREHYIPATVVCNIKLYSIRIKV